MKKRLQLMGFMIIFLLLTAISAYAEPGRFSVSIYGGPSWWVSTDDALDGYDDSDFEGKMTRGGGMGDSAYGGSIMYLYPGGLALELSVTHWSMDLIDSTLDLGTLHMTPVIFHLKNQWPAENWTGFTHHLEVGVGINFTSFDEDSELDILDVKVDTDDSLIFEAGGGLDYFFNKNFSLSLDGRFLIGSVGTKWKSGSVELPYDQFHTSSFQVLLTPRYWF